MIDWINSFSPIQCWEWLISNIHPLIYVAIVAAPNWFMGCIAGAYTQHEDECRTSEGLTYAFVVLPPVCFLSWQIIAQSWFAHGVREGEPIVTAGMITFGLWIVAFIVGLFIGAQQEKENVND